MSRAVRVLAVAGPIKKARRSNLNSYFETRTSFFSTRPDRRSQITNRSSVNLYQTGSSSAQGLQSPRQLGNEPCQARWDKKAEVALPRKLTVIMHRLLVDGMPFRDAAVA
jgi:hypothetical protein